MGKSKLTFESERLVFRPLSIHDLDVEIELWTDPEVVKYITGEVATEEEIAEQMPVVTQRAGDGSIGIWSLTQKETGRKIGHAVLLPLPVEADDTEWDLLASNDMPDRDIEIGYVLRRGFWGAGYATEACRRLLEFAFSETQLSVIVATTDPENAASQRVLEECGLRDQGLVRAFGQDVPDYRITRNDWLLYRAHLASE